MRETESAISLTRGQRLSKKSKKIGEPGEPVKWRRQPICNEKRKACKSVTKVTV